MRLRVRHHTEYRYDSTIAYAIQTLRLTPRAYEGLIVHDWRVRSGTGRELPSFIDGFGNVIHCHSEAAPHDAAAIFVEGDVETVNCWGVVRGAPETLPPAYYLRVTSLTEPDSAIAALANAALRSGSILKTLHALLNAVRERIDYRVGATEVTTTAAEALQSGTGVCQDHAHVFIAAARHLRIPARYVSGYLWTGEDGREYEASHAWAEALVPDLGWVGFDPSNRICPTEAYIRTSLGLDYWSAAPVRGVRRGVASEALKVSVKVMRGAAQQ
jgi:transglutaminase-like putative cysteine protease